MISEELQARPSVAAILERHAAAVQDGALDRNQAALFIEPAQIVAVTSFLKNERGFNRLSGITAVDWYPAEPRFEVVYLLHSLANNERLRLKCRVAEGEELESMTGTYASADWYEREIWDLFGIRFRNHPNLVRIMMPESWEGHPLRRDFPTHGHRYDYSSE